MLDGSYQKVKSTRRHFEHMWCKGRSGVSRQTVTWCEAVINRGTAEYYNTINDKSRDQKKNCGRCFDKSCARDKRLFFFLISLTTLWPISLLLSLVKKSGFPISFSTAKPPTCLPTNLSHFSEISENKMHVLKIITNSSTKSCLLDPVPTFHLKIVWTFYHHQLLKLSLAEGAFPSKFRKAVVAMNQYLTKPYLFNCTSNTHIWF